MNTYDQWWRDSVIYQIYPLTFADSNGDGMGDLQGIIQRLDYLNDGQSEHQTSLGIDAIWLCPIYPSPMVDNGYDVSHYTDIHPHLGTLADFDVLLQEAHQRDIKVILDLVINHTSDQHDWFAESRTSQDNPKADWYIWQDPTEDEAVPNNWLSYLGGSGWTFEPQRQQYYFHTFSPHQPDLNWRHPAVKEAIYKVIRFWFDRGVDGFRLDASSAYSKDPAFRNNPLKFGKTDADNYDSYHHLYDKNLPDNHQIIADIRKVLDEYEHKVLIGETFIDNQLYDSVAFYGPDQGELDLAFSFELPFSPWYPGYLHRAIVKKERFVPDPAWPTHFLDNHDLPRHLSHWIDCSLCTDSAALAKAAATLLLTVRGTSVLYYGQELGMEDNLEIPPEQRQDTASSPDQKDGQSSRDGARTPMQWDSFTHAGFSFGKTVKPWLPVHRNAAEVNIEVEGQDPNSVLNFYRQLLWIRKQSDALRRGAWKSLIAYPHEHLAYTRTTDRETVLILINFSGAKEIDLGISCKSNRWRVLLSTELQIDKVVDIPETLKPFEVSILRQE